MSGILVSPAINDLSLVPDGQDHPVAVKFTNNDNVARLITLSLRDIAAEGKTGRIQFLDAGDDGGFRLSKLATIASKSEVLVNPGEATSVTVNLHADGVLPPTGYYGALVAQVSDPATGGSVGVQPAVSSLFLARLTTSGEESVKLDKVDQTGNIFRLPTSVDVQIDNTSRVHTAPRGRVLLMTPNHTIIAQGVVNEQSNYLLPGASREFHTNLRTVEEVPWYRQVGTYHVFTEYRAAGVAQPRVNEQTIFYIHPGIFLLILLCLALLWSPAFFLWRKIAFRARNW